MPRRRIALLALLAAALAAPAADAQAPVGPVPLADGWEYRQDPSDAGEREGWQHGGPADDWERSSVPHVLDARPLDWNFGGTVGWYRIRLGALPAGDWAVRFAQARRRARVWLNGAELGGSDDAYAPFELPLRGLRGDGQDVLVVRIDSRKRRSVREGWWNWGGLTRPVELVPLGAATLRELGLMPRLRCGAGGCRARVIFDGVVANRSPSPQQPFVELTLTSPSGQVTRATLGAGALRPGASARLRREVPVAGAPEVWAPEHPALYDAVVETRVGGATVQVDRLRIGLRSVAVRGGLLYLNGRRLEMRGASIQEDVAGHGPALTDADVEHVAQELVALRANVTRAHYPLDERLLRRLDELGILVWNQAPVYHADRKLRSPVGQVEALRSVRSAVLAGRNHPSVMTHSVANELAAKADRVPGTRAFLERAAELVRRLDPTVPAAVDILTYPRIPRQRVYDRFDLLGVNNYFGWYPGRPPHSTRDFNDLEPYLHAMRRRYPHVALVMTEFGAEAVNDGPPSLRGTFGFQVDYLSRVLAVADRTDFLGGAIYWTLQEFAVKPRWDGGLGISSVAVDGIHNKGLITYDGARKPAWDVARERFAATPLYRR
jgi:beta-glucuronidase